MAGNNDAINITNKRDDKLRFIIVSIAILFLITYNFILPNIRIGLTVAEDNNGLYGYKNVLGMWVIKPKFNEANGFAHNFAVVKMYNESTGIVDKEYCINKQGDYVYEGFCYK